ncbi:MAG: exodeoxyribonuclease VII small subunit [Ktedonobacterales bacterium]
MSNERRRRGATSLNGASTPPPQDEPLAFEEALGRLDETVNALESGQLPLEEALRLYEEGVRLARRCQEMLDRAELRIQRLSLDEGASKQGDGDSIYILEPFDPDGDD